MFKNRFQKNIERAIRFDSSPESNGKPVIVFDPDKLEVEVFIRLKGDSGEPKSIGTYPASKISIGED